MLSYWYGKVKEIYWKTTLQNQYYGQIDLEDEDINLAACVGEYELVLSDHTSIVDMHCVETHATIVQYDEGDVAQPQIPTKTLYNRWTMHMKFVNRGKAAYLDGVNISSHPYATYRTHNHPHGVVATHAILHSLPPGMCSDSAGHASGGLMRHAWRILDAGWTEKPRVAIKEAIKLGSLSGSWKDDIHKAGLTLTSVDELIP
ncbi:hypothetical protein EV702DRAFT_1044814 [Suillus placidus]|uniref:Uncharacterized protein n=1 Tax=Suillus placidus TaxID=48579 RepID=A0A9P6ZXA6_9AGAM|nr:hypothetical protein EV702DRAFT_1044814 [Suillus placidus]